MSSFVLPVLISFALMMILGPVGIPILTKLKAGQYIREEGPKEHQKKAGTPTMGGILFLIAFLMAVLVMFTFDREIGMILLMTMGFGIIGFIDDYIKVVKHHNEGLNVAQKWFAQCAVALAFVLWMAFSGYSTELVIPFTSVSWNLSWFYWVIAFFFIMAFVNGVNFTDGLDGLASEVTSVVVIFFAIMAFKASSTMVIPAGAMLGCLLGFLCFNVNKAKVFMGDTGSLALGGFVTSFALIMNRPLILVVVGFVYVMEVLSVVMQVSYFKATHGKRIFKMAPIHHHFELSGWKETKVVAIFTIVTVLLSVLSLLTL